MVMMVGVEVFRGFVAGEGKRLHIGNDSQKMPKCDDKYFKNINIFQRTV